MPPKKGKGAKGKNLPLRTAPPRLETPQPLQVPTPAQTPAHQEPREGQAGVSDIEDEEEGEEEEFARVSMGLARKLEVMVERGGMEMVAQLVLRTQREAEDFEGGERVAKELAKTYLDRTRTQGEEKRELTKRIKEQDQRIAELDKDRKSVV